MPQVYTELHRIVTLFLRGERRGHTLRTTDLVHEVYVKLIPEQEIDWKSRAHLFGVAARCMRRILADFTRKQGAENDGALRRTLQRRC